MGVPVPAFGGMTRLGAGPTVAEVDDSDLTLRGVDTEVAVVTNLDDDHPHLDVTLAQAVTAVGEYVARARRHVILGPSPRAATIASAATADVWQHGRDFAARTVSVDGTHTVVELRGPGGERCRATIGLLGPKIESNAALAFATALALGADADAAAKGLGTVTSMYRRLERVGSRDGVVVVDDFGGKHPVAVREGIARLRRHYPAARITAVFEPYGPYLARWGRRYARALSHADRVVLVPPIFLRDYDAGKAFDDSWASGIPGAEHAVDQDDAVSRALALSGPGDLVVFFAQANASRAMALGAVGRPDSS
jgi:UDP-N-acetylmuramate--alanine ligase